MIDRAGHRAAFAIAALLASAALCEAQVVGPGQQARRRYEQRTRGTNIDDFVRKLQSEEPEKRLEAVRSLGESHDEKAVEYLLQALGDADVRVQAKAVDMLGYMRAAEATPVLIQYLFLRSTDPQLKTRILAALGKIGDARAARPIAEFLQRDLDPETRGTAIYALGEIGSADAEETLHRFARADADPRIRRLAGEALAKVRQRQAVRAVEAKEPAETFLPPEFPGRR